MKKKEKTTKAGVQTVKTKYGTFTTKKGTETVKKKGKRLVTAITLLILSLQVYSQEAPLTFSVKENVSKGFNVNSGEATGETFVVEGKSFDVFTTKNGSRYIKAIGKTSGNEYPVWIGQNSGYTFTYKGVQYSVYRFSSGSYCIYLLSSSGYPYPKWLEAR